MSNLAKNTITLWSGHEAKGKFTENLDNLDLHNIFHAFPARATSFALKYIEQPLAVSILKKIHVQSILDKITTKLAPWQWRLMTAAGRTSLTKSVLTTLPIYQLTALDISDGTLREVDKLRWKFLWVGAKTSRTESAKLTGRGSAGQRILVGAGGSWICTDLQGRCGCVGRGSNG